MIEKKFYLFDEDPKNPEAKPHGTIYMSFGEADPYTLQREVRVLTVRSIHANGSMDSELPIVYEAIGTLHDGDVLVETWRSPCRNLGRELVGAAVYKFDDHFDRATFVNGKTAYVWEDRGVVGGDTWLKAV